MCKNTKLIGKRKKLRGRWGDGGWRLNVGGESLYCTRKTERAAEESKNENDLWNFGRDLKTKTKQKKLQLVVKK